MPVPTPAKFAVLMCRHGRLGAACPEAMAQLPDELWDRVFHLARLLVPYPNAVELGPPPGSNATAGVIHAPTPTAAGGGAEGEPDARRYECALAYGPSASQLELYEGVGAHLLQAALEGTV